MIYQSINHIYYAAYTPRMWLKLTYPFQSTPAQKSTKRSTEGRNTPNRKRRLPRRPSGDSVKSPAFDDSRRGEAELGIREPAVVVVVIVLTAS